MPGLIQPFSLAAVEAPTHYTITANFITIFHFVIVKGQADVSPQTVKEILETLIARHLTAQDLPLTVPPVYTNSESESYPGLVCDGIHDCGQFYKVDLVITNEAEIIRLKARAISSMNNTVVTPPSDPDFS